MLERGLVAQPLERVRGDVGHWRAGRCLSQRAQRGQPAIAQPGHLVAAHAGDLHQVVLGLPAGGAHRAKVTERAVLHRVGLGHLRRGDRRLEPRAHAPVVRREVVVPERALLADPEQHVHALGRHALNGRDAGAVEAELQDVRGLLGARQLGVERLVAPGAEPGGPLDLDEEVRAPAPPAIHERGLRDDLGAGPHGLCRLSRRRLEVPRLAERDLDDLAPLGPEPLEVGALVQLALAPQQLRVLVGDERPGALAARDLERQRRQVRALEVVVQVGGGKRDAAAHLLHDALSLPARCDRDGHTGILQEFSPGFRMLTTAPMSRWRASALRTAT